MTSHTAVPPPEQDQDGEGGAPACPHHATPKLLDLSNPHFHDTSLEVFAELRAQCPVARVTFHDGSEDKRPRGPFQRDAFLVTRYDDGNAALLDNRIGVDPRRAMTEEQLAQLPEPPAAARLFQRNLLGVDPPNHTRLRKLVQPSFTNRQMDALRPRIQAIVDHQLDRAEAAAAERGEIAPNRTMELIEAFSFPMPIQVICDMLGIPAEDQVDVRRWFLALPIGEGTTVNLIASGTLLLLTHPTELAKVRANPDLMKNAVEEILRYWGPLDTTLPRFATEDLTIDGVEIPRGETIMVGLSSANHDPERFTHPEIFDITREDANRHIAFGKGIHVCLGAPLARMEGDIALTTLLARYPDLRLAVPAEEIAWKPGLLRALKQLPLAF